MINIIWTQRAIQSLELVYLQTLHYTKSDLIAAQLHNKLIKEVEILKTFPNAGSLITTSDRITLNYRALVADANYKLIYYIESNENIVIITVWDVRQNPNKLVESIE